MQRLVIDTNFLQNKGFEEYLSAAPDNFGLISQVTLIEVHKRLAADTVRQAMQIACKYPKQIVILQDLTDLVYMPATKSPLYEMVDHSQTETFDQYCETMIKAPMNEEIAARFKLHQAESKEFVDDMLPTAPNIFNLFCLAEKSLKASEIGELLKRTHFSGDLQRKVVELAFAIREMLIQRSEAGPDKFPMKRMEIIDTYLFRYTLVIALFFTRWVKAIR